jgi:tetratricopeptide (TPR) repeat protein
MSANVSEVEMTNALPNASLALGLCFGLWGCAINAQKCLNTPISSKVRQEAVDVCEEAVRANMDRQDVFHRFVGLLRVRQRYDDIVKWSKRVLKRDEDRTDALYNLAYGLRKTGDCEAALRKYKSYAKRNKEDPDPYFGMGLCHEDLRNSQAAIDAFQLYIEKEDRKGQKAWVERARARIAALRGAPPPPAAVAVQPQRPAGLVKPPGAVKPPSPLAPFPGVAPPAAAPPAATPPAATPPAAAPPAAAAPAASADCSAHERAFKADPFNTDAYDKFADCALAAGRHDDVIRAMRIATRDNPDFSRGFLHLGRAYKAKGMAQSAKGYFAKACSAGVPEACGQ